MLLVARIYLVALLTLTGPLTVAQTKTNLPKAQTTSTDAPTDDSQDVEVLKTDTNLVMVPVVATDRGGMYIPDLTQNDFTLSEDGVPQQISFFSAITKPFHVVLMLDTSASTRDKLRLIQNAAYAFVQQLKPADRVKVISFDDSVRDLNDFTSDRETLKAAINGTSPGQGTKVYDALEMAFNTVRRIQGRKAIVLFTDGVDWHSDTATYDSTIKGLDEEGVIIYPIRYDTRAETERMLREQSEQTGPQLPTIDVIRRPPSGTTAPTFPGGDPIPTTGTQQRTGPFGLPLPGEILRRRTETDPRNDPNQPFPGSTPSRMPRTDPPVGTDGRTIRNDDSISRILDPAYQTADQYLEALSTKSGGRLLRADTLVSLPDAFAKIAAELRTQYLLGYYPINKARNNQYRKIAVKTTRKDVAIRSRPGYVSKEGR
jgi:Ca-activated chloride channel family protein